MSLFPRRIGCGGRVVVHFRLNRDGGPPLPAHAEIHVLDSRGAAAARFDEALMVAPGPTVLERWWTVAVPAGGPPGRWEVTVDFFGGGQRLGSQTAAADHFFVECVEPVPGPRGRTALRNVGPEPVEVALFADRGHPLAPLTLPPFESRALPFADTEEGILTICYADGRTRVLAADGRPPLMRAPARDAAAVATLSGAAESLWHALIQPRMRSALEARYGSALVADLTAQGLLFDAAQDGQPPAPVGTAPDDRSVGSPATGTVARRRS